MSTSLAEQLKKLAVPQTSLLIQGKTRPSLLFDPREAAKFDRDTIYEIGINLLFKNFSIHHMEIRLNS
jgi:U3 small nucleolar RNA-associated protein 10